MNKKIRTDSKGLTPNKQKRRPSGGDPSPVKPFKISSGSSKATTYRKQGR